MCATANTSQRSPLHYTCQYGILYKCWHVQDPGHSSSRVIHGHRRSSWHKHKHTKSPSKQCACEIIVVKKKKKGERNKDNKKIPGVKINIQV